MTSRLSNDLLADRLPTTLSGSTVPWLLLVLCLALYGRQLTVGYLADDVLYLRWLDTGLGELLRKVTVASDPQMIRPLPALAWMLSWLPGGAVLQHGLSLLLHTAVATLLARRIAAEPSENDASSPWTGLFWGALFLAVPLFGEPVIWLSSATDLWAAALALAALELACPLRRETPLSGGRILAASLVFGLALLSKETVLLLPVVAWAVGFSSSAGSSRSAWHLSPKAPRSAWHLLRRPEMALATVAAAYLTVRVLLFGGFGGYLDDDGTSQALTFDPKTSLRNLGFQLPMRLLFPLIGDEGMPLAALLGLGMLSLLAMGGFAVASWRRHGFPRLPVLVPVAIAVLAAVAPVLPVLSVDAHHGGGRLVYWPLAIGIWGLSRCLPRASSQRPWAAVWLALWCVAAVHNSMAWSQAGQRMQAAVRQLPDVAQSLPEGSQVLFGGRDSWRGAYLWRNAFHTVLERQDLGHGHQWQLGSVADLANAHLGGYRFVALDEDLQLVDRTDCAVDLRRAPEMETLQHTEEPGVWTARLAPTSGPVALRLVGFGGPGDGFHGRIYWRRGARGRFGISVSKTFWLGPGRSRTVVLLEPETGNESLNESLEVYVQPLPPGEEPLKLVRVELPQACF